MSFVHLHVHSYYSLLDGAASPEELIIAAKGHGMKALALTDHNALYGAVEFYRLALEYNIKPIIGAELDVDGARLVLLVKNSAGYRNLCRAISRGHLQGGHLKFVLGIETLAKHKEGLVILSAGHQGTLNGLLQKRDLFGAIRYIRRMKNIFKENFYIELQQFEAADTLVNLRLRDLAAENNIPVVAGNDIWFLSSGEWGLRRTLQAIDDNCLQEKVTRAGSSEQYFKSSVQMTALFKAFPGALDNTRRIADSCSFAFELDHPVFPSIKLPEKETDFSWLWKKSFAGAGVRYKPLVPAVTTRLEYELNIIRQLGFAGYFLIVQDIVDFCRREHIPCVGRGSAADSLVAYCLQITQVDPLRHNLYFERFLNPERVDPPDIDLDICWKNRDRVIRYVYEKYGAGRTAMICTFNTLQNRSAIREVAKTYGLPEVEIVKITKHLPHRPLAQIEQTVNSIPELHDLRHNLPLYKEILQTAGRLSGFPRHLSIHPGGVIIAPDTLANYTPLEVAGKGIVIAQYDMHSIKSLGLVKMDLLGVRGLSVLTDCIRELSKDRGRQDGRSFSGRGVPDFFSKNSQELSPLDLHSIPEDDPAVTAFIRSGHTLGCFQLESPAMRGLLKKMAIESVEDVIVAVALIRPGASGSGMKEVYIRRRAGLEQTEYLHPSLKPALEETYGVVIYQEQVLQIARHVAGLSYARGDSLRRAMSKSRDRKEFMSVHNDFIDGALGRGVDKQSAETLWQHLAQFTGYGFNKAHAATYGVIAYQSAFLKYYFPLEYMCAVLNNHGGFYGKAAYIEEARRMKIQLLPPDVNSSAAGFTCEGETVRCGLSPVFELTERTIKAILRERALQPFNGLYDFIRRTRAGQKETEHLIKAGAMQTLHPSAPQLLMQTQLFYKNKGKTAVAEFVAGGAQLPNWGTGQKIINEMEMLDFAVSDHPLALFEADVDFEDIVFSRDLEAHTNGVVRCLGWQVTARRVKTASERYMKFLTLEDRQGLFEVVLFPDVYERFGHLLRGHGPFIITGRVQSRLPGEANLIAGRVEVLKKE